MSEMVLYLGLGAAFLILFLLWALSGQPEGGNKTPPMAPIEQFVSLPGLAFEGADLLLNDADYRMLRSRPALRPLGQQLKRERGRIALLWLRLLQQDMMSLWRFRRLLVRNGASVRVGSEIRVAVTAFLALLLLFSLRVLVALVGPFAFFSLMSNARNRVEKSSRVCAELLAQLPPSKWPEIQRTWAAEATPVG